MRNTLPIAANPPFRVFTQSQNHVYFDKGRHHLIRRHHEQLRAWNNQHSPGFVSCVCAQRRRKARTISTRYGNITSRIQQVSWHDQTFAQPIQERLRLLLVMCQINALGHQVTAPKFALQLMWMVQLATEPAIVQQMNSLAKVHSSSLQPLEG